MSISTGPAGRPAGPESAADRLATGGA